MEKYVTNIEINTEGEIEAVGDSDSNIETESTQEELLLKSQKAKKVDRGADVEYIRPRKRSLGSIIRFYILNLILGMIILIIAAGIFVVSCCSLTGIEYQGIVNSNKDEITAALFSDKYSDNAIYAWAINLVKSPGEIDFVDKISVYLKDKNTVVVSVTEKEVVGYIPSSKEFVYFDSEGRITAINQRIVPNVCRISGIKVSEPVVGKTIELGKGQKNAIVNTLKYLKEVNIFPEKIVFDKDNTYGFYLGEVFVDMGIKTSIREKCKRLPYILPSIAEEKGVLHLEEWGRENSDIIFEKTS